LEHKVVVAWKVIIVVTSIVIGIVLHIAIKLCVAEFIKTITEIMATSTHLETTRTHSFPKNPNMFAFDQSMRAHLTKNVTNNDLVSSLWLKTSSIHVLE